MHEVPGTRYWRITVDRKFFDDMTKEDVETFIKYRLELDDEEPVTAEILIDGNDTPET